MSRAGRVERADRCREDAFLRHTRLLGVYYEQAFRRKNPDFFGEVAGKVRLMVHKSRSNDPILLPLMEKYGVEYRVMYPRNGKSLPLDEYLDELAGAFRAPSGRLASMSNRELVVAWAQQSGAAHEAQFVQEDLYAAFSTGLVVGGAPPHVIKLEKVSSNVLAAAEQVAEVIRAHATET